MYVFGNASYLDCILKMNSLDNVAANSFLQCLNFESFFEVI